MPGIEEIVGEIISAFAPLITNCQLMCRYCDPLTGSLETFYNSLSSLSYITTMLCGFPSTICSMCETLMGLPYQLCGSCGTLCTFPCAAVYPLYAIAKIPRDLCTGGFSTGMSGGWAGPSSSVGNIISVCFMPSSIASMCGDVIGIPYQLVQLVAGCINCIAGFFGCIGMIVPEIGMCGVISVCAYGLDLFGFVFCLGAFANLLGILSTVLSVPPSILELCCSVTEVGPGIYDLLRNIVGIPFKCGQNCLGMEWIPLTIGVFIDTCQGIFDPIAACAGAITGCVQRPWLVPI